MVYLVLGRTSVFLDWANISNSSTSRAAADGPCWAFTLLMFDSCVEAVAIPVTPNHICV